MIFKDLKRLCFSGYQAVETTEQRRNTLSAGSPALPDRLLKFYWKQF